MPLCVASLLSLPVPSLPTLTATQTQQVSLRTAAKWDLPSWTLQVGWKSISIVMNCYYLTYLNPMCTFPTDFAFWNWGAHYILWHIRIDGIRLSCSFAPKTAWLAYFINHSGDGEKDHFAPPGSFFWGGGNVAGCLLPFCRMIASSPQAGSRSIIPHACLGVMGLAPYPWDKWFTPKTGKGTPSHFAPQMGRRSNQTGWLPSCRYRRQSMSHWTDYTLWLKRLGIS